VTGVVVRAGVALLVAGLARVVGARVAAALGVAVLPRIIRLAGITGLVVVAGAGVLPAVVGIAAPPVAAARGTAVLGEAVAIPAVVVARILTGVTRAAAVRGVLAGVEFP